MTPSSVSESWLLIFTPLSLPEIFASTLPNESTAPVAFVLAYVVTPNTSSPGEPDAVAVQMVPPAPVLHPAECGSVLIVVGLTPPTPWPFTDESAMTSDCVFAET